MLSVSLIDYPGARMEISLMIPNIKQLELNFHIVTYACMESMKSEPVTIYMPHASLDQIISIGSLYKIEDRCKLEILQR